MGKIRIHHPERKLPGKTIQEVSEPFNGTLRLTMTDGTVYEISGFDNEETGRSQIDVDQIVGG